MDIRYRRFSLVLLALIAALVAFAPDAFAQQANQVTLTAQDLQVKSGDLASGLLDAVVGTGTGADRSMLGVAMAYLNAFVLVVAAWMFLGNIWIAVIKTAEDGEFMGKHVSPIWMPIRMVLAVGLLAPSASGTGLSVVQEAVIWTAKAGIAMGSTAANGVMAAAVRDQSGLVSVAMQSSSETLSVMRTALKAETCTAARNVALNPPGSTGPGEVYGMTTVGGVADALVDNNSYIRFGNSTTNPEYGASDECGSVEFAQTGEASLRASVVGDKLVSTQNALAAARLAAMQVAVADLQPIAKRFATLPTDANPSPAWPTSAEINAALEKASADYDSSTIAYAKSSLTAFVQPMKSAMQQSVAADGWISVGQWYYQIARLNSSLVNVANRKPTVVGPEAAAICAMAEGCGEQTATESAIDAAYRVATKDGMSYKRIDQAVGQRVPGLLNASGQRQPLAVDAAALGTSGGISGFVGRIANSLGSGIGHLVGVDPANPTSAIVQLKSSGDGMIDGALALMGASKIAGALIPGGLLGKIAGFGNSEWASVALWAIAGAGVMLAYVLPLAPFAIFWAATIGWLITVIELLVAAPLWAAAHLVPGGDSLASPHGTRGYLLFIEVLAKPLLIVCSFAFAAMAVDPLLKLLAGLYFNATGSVETDSGINAIVGSVVYAFLYAVICVSTANRIFSLIHTLPGHILGILGSSSTDHARDFAESSTHISGVAIGRLGGVTQKAGDKVLGGKRKPGGGGATDKGITGSTPIATAGE